MKRDLALAFKEFNKDSWLLLGLTFFVRAGFFMTIPYFSFYLYRHGYSSIQIGFVVASGPLVASLLNIWSGFLTDKFGKKTAMTFSFLVMAFANECISIGDGFWWYLLLNMVLRFADSTFNSAMQAYLSDNFSEDVRRLVFNIRFMVINAAGAIGPIGGALFSEMHTKFLFEFSAALSLAGALVLFFFLSPDKKHHVTDKPQITLQAAVSTLMKDKTLLWITAAFFMYWFCYLQLDSTLAQVIAHVFPENGVIIFAMMWVINTLMIVLFQLPIMHLTRGFSDKQTCIIAAVLLMSGFFVIAGWLTSTGLIVGMALVTLGEILLSPLGSLFVAKIAAPEIRATYFGAFNLSFMGAGFAPIIGSACLSFMHYSTLLVIFGCLSLFFSAFMLLAIKHCSSDAQ